MWIDSSIIKGDLIQLFKAIQKAKMHVRGSKTRDAINNAVLIMKYWIKKTNINEQNLKRKTKTSKHICKDIYQLDKGFKTQKCSYSTSLDKLVTVLIVLKPDENSLQSTIESLCEIHKNIKIIIGKLNNVSVLMLERNSNVIFVKYTKQIQKDKFGTYLYKM